jgi:carbon-monoxide dehydrogenase medium subunit
VFRWRDAEQALKRRLRRWPRWTACSIDPDLLLDDERTPARYRANLVEVFTRRAVAALAVR